MPGNDNETFASVIDASREVPKSAEPKLELDIPQMFPQKAPNPNVGEIKEGGGLELKYTAHSAVYVLWKPWWKCGRCKRDIEKDETLLPDVGDYNCPHNNTADYKEIVDRCLSGDFIRQQEEFTNLVDGTRTVHIVWLETDPEQMKKLAEAEAAKKAAQVYPPNIEEAFKETPAEENKDKETEEAKA